MSTSDHRDAKNVRDAVEDFNKKMNQFYSEISQCVYRQLEHNNRGMTTPKSREILQTVTARILNPVETIDLIEILTRHMTMGDRSTKYVHLSTHTTPGQTLYNVCPGVVCVIGLRNTY